MTALLSGDASFNSTTGVLAVTLQGSETLVVVSQRAADKAILLNGDAVIDTTKTVFALSTNVKRINLTVGAANTTVIYDFYNGTFAPGTKPTSPALFGAAGSLVSFGAFTGGAFKVRGTSNADTFYVGQDAASTPNVLIDFSGATAYPDIEVSATATPSLGFSLGAGNDVFDGTSGKGGVTNPCSYAMTVHGGVGNDTIIGGTGADTIYGDEGLNTVDESSGSATSHTADTVYGLTTPASVTGANSTTVTYANWAGSSGVTVKVAHLATALIGGVTDNIDDTVGQVTGSPLADTMWCSQLTDVPCVLWGGAGNDTLVPGLSANNTEYLYGGDGNDTFAMNLIGNKVWVNGGNPTDISTTKNLYVDTVDYSAAISTSAPVNSTISMNGAAPATCNAATSTTIPPCPGTVDSTLSGLVGSAGTSIRNDVTVAKCPTGIHSTGVVCTVKGNANGDTIYSGEGADVLTGGAGDDTFVFADMPVAFGVSAKVVTGGGGNDTADFSGRTTGVVIDLDNSGANSGNLNAALGSTEAADVTAAGTDNTTAAATITTASTGLAALYAAGTPGALDTAVETAALAVEAAAAAAVTAAGTAKTNVGNSSDAFTAAADIATFTTDLAALNTAVAADSASTVTGYYTQAQAVATAYGTVATDLAGTPPSSEGISLVNINDVICPAQSSALMCEVITNGNADLIDFSGDGAAVGSSLTCNSSNVVTVNASTLAANCGL